MKAKTLAILLAVLVAAGLLIYRQSRLAPPVPASITTELLPVKRAPALHLPAPRMPAAAPASEARGQDSRPTNLLARLLKGEEVKLTREQVEPWLQANRRSAGSLMAGFRLTQDPKLLREALAKYPNDPRVNYAAYFAPVCNGNLKGEFPPEERRQLLDAFKQSAPDNALANYLSAQNYFEAGNTDRAVEELQAAAGKTRLQDYSMDFVQNAEEAYRAAGYSEAEAKAMATLSLPLPDLAQLRGLSQSLNELATLYRRSGDEESAQAALQIGLDLGQRLAGRSETLPTSIQEMVSLKIQEKILAGLDPASPYGTTGQTVKDRLAELAQQRAALVELGKQESTLLPALSGPDLISFFDRVKIFGEAEAFRWLLSRQPAGTDL